MDTSQIKTPEDFLQLIKSNSKPLLPGKIQTELMDFIDSMEKTGKQSDEYERVIKLAHSMANQLDKFDDDDFSSLMSFFVLMQINDYGTFLSFENAKDKVMSKGYEKQALFLKLLSTINNSGFSKLQMSMFSDIKKEYPLFWADLYFEIDIYESIDTLKNSGIDFNVMIKMINKWIKSLTKDNPSHAHKLKVIERFEKENNFFRETVPNEAFIQYAKSIVNKQKLPDLCLN